MKKLNILLGLVIVWSYLFFSPLVKQTFAADCNPDKHGITNISISPSEFMSGEEDKVHVSFNTSQINTPNGEYRVIVEFSGSTGETAYKQKDDHTSYMSFDITEDKFLNTGVGFAGKYKADVFLQKKGGFLSPIKWCKLGIYTIDSRADYSSNCLMTLSQERDGKTCYYSADSQCLEKGAETKIRVTGLKKDGELFSGQAFAKIERDGSVNLTKESYTIEPGVFEIWGTDLLNKATSHTISIHKVGLSQRTFCEGFGPFEVVNNCTNDQCNEDEGSFPPSGSGEENRLCKQVPVDKGQTECVDCFDDGGIWTSLGCISNQDTKGIVEKIVTIGISLAGGIALLIILAAAFILSTSQGEPKRTSEAKEMLTHAIIGLLFIIFSITILEFIGVNILRIPEFGE